jgi:hypothetical protein
LLHQFIAIHRDEIIRRCRSKVASRSGLDADEDGGAIMVRPLEVLKTGNVGVRGSTGAV